MSDGPNARTIHGLISMVESSSHALGDRADTLSHTIEEIDSRLRELPGKIPHRVEEGPRAVGFSKLSREWCLWYTDEDSEGNGIDLVAAPLVNAPIIRKARVFPLLIQLLCELDGIQRQTVSDIDQAFAKLHDMGGK